MVDMTYFLQLMANYALSVVALVFLLDGLGLPLVPELAALAAFAKHPTLAWGLQILFIIVAMEVVAAVALYVLVDRLGVPLWLRRAMNGYAQGMLLHDERLLLLNRVIPVLPVAGAFIRVNEWRPRRSFAFIALGSLAKYGLVLAFSGAAFGYFTDRTAFLVSLGLAALFLAVSWTITIRRWALRRAAQADVS